MALMFQHQSH